ncbi:MAG TPA: nuclease [Pseudolysinimonas sp.]|nr:nuclease [Pseudolysinimonas sp.]
MSDNTTTRILAIQRVMACASPSGWRDALVVSIAEGTAELATLTGEIVRVSTLAPVVTGEPVAYHPVAEVLALGADWYSAR